MQAELSSTREIETFKIELENTGFTNAPYDNVVFTFHPSFASQYLLAVGNRDESRRNSARKVLHEARQNFHRHPRPWWMYRPYWYDDCLAKGDFGRPHVLTLHFMFAISAFTCPALCEHGVADRFPPQHCFCAAIPYFAPVRLFYRPG